MEQLIGAGEGIAMLCSVANALHQFEALLVSASGITCVIAWSYIGCRHVRQRTFRYLHLVPASAAAVLLVKRRSV